MFVNIVFIYLVYIYIYISIWKKQACVTCVFIILRNDIVMYEMHNKHYPMCIYVHTKNKQTIFVSISSVSNFQNIETINARISDR
jgi:hypothetical protein